MKDECMFVSELGKPLEKKKKKKKKKKNVKKNLKKKKKKKKKKTVEKISKKKKKNMTVFYFHSPNFLTINKPFNFDSKVYSILFESINYLILIIYQRFFLFLSFFSSFYLFIWGLPYLKEVNKKVFFDDNSNGSSFKKIKINCICFEGRKKKKKKSLGKSCF